MVNAGLLDQLLEMTAVPEEDTEEQLFFSLIPKSPNNNNNTENQFQAESKKVDQVLMDLIAEVSLLLRPP